MFGLGVVVGLLLLANRGDWPDLDPNLPNDKRKGAELYRRDFDRFTPALKRIVALSLPLGLALLLVAFL